MFPSELQLSLIGAGAVAVAAVWGYNLWVEHQHRKAAQRIFREMHPDVLGPDQSEPGIPPSGDVRNADPGRVEPVIHRAVAHPPAPVAEPDASLCDPAIELVLALDAARPIPAHRLRQLQTTLTQEVAKPQRCLIEAGDAWQALSADSAGDASHIRYVLQLADRRGAAAESDFKAIEAALSTLAEQYGGRVGPQDTDIDSCLRQAQDIDARCARVDVQIAVHLVPRGEAGFGGEQLAGLFEKLGLRIGPDGNFYCFDDAGQAQFSVTCDGAVPFVETKLPELHTDGFTFWLDVPRVSDGGAVFDRMVAAAGTLAVALDGILVDDQRRALGERELAGIRAKIIEIQTLMSEAEIPAGGSRALRLFV